MSAIMREGCRGSPSERDVALRGRARDPDAVAHAVIDAARATSIFANQLLFQGAFVPSPPPQRCWCHSQDRDL